MLARFCRRDFYWEGANIRDWVVITKKVIIMCHLPSLFLFGRLVGKSGRDASPFFEE